MGGLIYDRGRGGNGWMLRMQSKRLEETRQKLYKTERQGHNMQSVAMLAQQSQKIRESFENNVKNPFASDSSSMTPIDLH